MNKEETENVTNIEEIDDVNEDYEHIDFSQINEETCFNDYLDYMYNPEYNLDDKITLLNQMIDKFPDKITEFVQKVVYTYIYTEIKYFTSFLQKIVKTSNLNFGHKLEIAKSLCFMEKTDKSLLFLCDKILNDHIFINELLYFDAVKSLVENEHFREKGLYHLQKFIINNYVDIDYRYKSIFSIKAFDLEEKIKNILFLDMMYLFYNSSPYITYKILVCQYFIMKEQKDERVPEFIDALFTFAQDIELDENVRADAVDVLLRTRERHIRERAFMILNELGLSSRKKISIYDNSQNVHTNSIEKSAICVLDKLFDNMKEKEILICTFSDVLTYFDKVKETLEEEPKKTLNKSLTRISFDQATYGRENHRLMNILCLVFTYISTHEHSEEMKKRLLEELIDSSGVCSTGNAFRLINVLSGFGEYDITISFEDQFKAKFQLLLEKKCNEIEDEDYKMDIFMDMTHTEHSNKNAFLKFFMSCFGEINGELRKDFKDYISETEFEEYLRTCVSYYMNH